MAGLNGFVVTIGLVLIFTIGLLNLGISFAENNNAVINIENSDFTNSVEAQARADGASGFITANGTATSFEESSILESSESGTLVTGSVFKNAYKDNIKPMYNVFSNGWITIFGSDARFGNILGIIVTLITIVGTFLIWKAWKGGNPE